MQVLLLWNVEEHGRQIDKAFQHANNKTDNKPEAEKARILADSQCTANIRNKSQRFSNKFKKGWDNQALLVNNSYRG